MINESRFYEIEPSNENYWRAIILFGKNVASYKFALAKTLYEFRERANDLVRLDELAPVFAGHIAEHLKLCAKQTTSPSSSFLEVCRSYNTGEISRNVLAEQTVRLGFQNVIDAFHNVHGSEIPNRFFLDERKSSGGIRLTNNFFSLTENAAFYELNLETEARWRLVETAWNLNVSKHVVQVMHDDTNMILHALSAQKRRVAIASSRHALNGYQKGRCFYCYREISVDNASPELADVDHFFPHKLIKCAADKPINGVANLVLACKECNRGVNGKSDRLPGINHLERLHTRNEYLIKSYHPLRETLMLQTGTSEVARRAYLQNAYNCAKSTLVVNWAPNECGTVVF